MECGSEAWNEAQVSSCYGQSLQLKLGWKGLSSSAQAWRRKTPPFQGESSKRRPKAGEMESPRRPRPTRGSEAQRMAETSSTEQGWKFSTGKPPPNGSISSSGISEPREESLSDIGHMADAHQPLYGTWSFTTQSTLAAIFLACKAYGTRSGA